jgi:hypothetical protein
MFSTFMAETGRLTDLLANRTTNFTPILMKGGMLPEITIQALVNIVYNQFY